MLRFPSRKLQWSQTKAHHIARVQIFEFTQHQRNKSFAINLQHSEWHPCASSRIGGGLIVANDGGDDFIERCPIAQAERIGRHQMLLHGHVLLA